MSDRVTGGARLELRAPAPEPGADLPHMRAFWAILACVAIVRFALVLAIDPAFGFHRDELLYFAMGDHLDFWRMQFPPLIALVARIGTAVFGDTSTMAARAPAAIAGIALTAVVMRTAQRMGAGTIALTLTAIATVAGPLMVRSAVLMQPVVFDQLWYALAALGLLMATQGAWRGWMWLGLGLGLGGLTKFSVAFFAVGIVVAVLASPELRAALRTRSPYMAAGLALTVALPSFVGQQVHGWPFLVQAAQLRSGQLSHVTASAYFSEQALMFGGALLLLPFAFAAATRDRMLRPLGVAALAVVIVLFLMGGKAYYAAPVYMPLIAVGAVAVERVAQSRRWMVATIASLMLAIGVALVPAGSPLLAPAAMSRYALALGITATNTGDSLTLPQDYADMTGWREEVAAVAEVWEAMPSEERAATAILAINYGRAGALARFGPSLGLPYPVSLHGDFWAWGSGEPSVRNAIVVGETAETVAPFCSDAHTVRTVRNPRGVDEEQNVAITICRGLRLPLRDLWAKQGPQWG